MIAPTCLPYTCVPIMHWGQIGPTKIDGTMCFTDKIEHRLRRNIAIGSKGEMIADKKAVVLGFSNCRSSQEGWQEPESVAAAGGPLPSGFRGRDRAAKVATLTSLFRP